MNSENQLALKVEKMSQVRLTSNFVGLKTVAIMFFITAPYIFFIQDKNPLIESIFYTIMIWGISLGIWFYAKTRNKVFYDQEKFYIYNWKGVEIDIVPNEKITSMLFSGFRGNSWGYAYRLFYDAKEGKKKEFWIFPNSGTYTCKIKKRLKQINPNLLTTNFSFGGIEHLFIRNEDGFR